MSVIRSCVIGWFAAMALLATPAGAQQAAEQAYSQDELDQLLAPIALYPDQLLTQVLIAATYPLEVVEAARFVQQNPSLKGDALDQALEDKNWDPSVQSLAAFPQVLAMMNDQLEWMQRLGDAFLVDETRVMDTVQALRRKAQAAGNLQSTPQQSVLSQQSEIIIEPIQPDVVYVPVYDPRVIYGPWWVPDYLPWFWYPPPIYGYPIGFSVGIVFGHGWGVSHHHWGWARPDWHGHHINLDTGGSRFWNRPGHPRPPPGATWQHTPGHRRGVSYPDAATQDRFIRADPGAVRARQEFRGHDVRLSAPDAVRPSPNAIRPAPRVVQPSPDAMRPTPRIVQPSPDAIRPTPRVVQPSPDATRPAPRIVQPSPDAMRPAPRIVQPSPGAMRPTPQIVQPPPRASAPTFDPGLSRQQAQINAQRGMQSRQSAGPPPSTGGRGAPEASAPRGGGRQR